MVVLGSAQGIVVTPTSIPYDDAVVQYCLDNFGFQHPDLQPEGGTRSVVQFEGVFPEDQSRIVYAPVDFDGQVGAVVDVLHEVYKIMRFLHLTDWRNT